MYYIFFYYRYINNSERNLRILFSPVPLVWIKYLVANDKYFELKGKIYTMMEIYKVYNMMANIYKMMENIS